MSVSVVQQGATAYNTSATQTAAYIGWSGYGNPGTDVAVLNAGASSFNGTVPSGFSAWDTTGATTWDSGSLGAHMSLSGSNLTVTKASSQANWTSARSNTAKYSGKWYFEIECSTLSSGQIWSQIFGLVASTFTTADYVGQANSLGAQTNESSVLGGTGSWSDTVSSGTYVYVAVDMDAGEVWFATSGSPTNWNGSTSNSPASGTGGIAIGSQFSPVIGTGPYIDFGSEPSQNNLLLALGFIYESNSDTPLSASGWTKLTDNTTGNWTVFACYKYAGAGELQINPLMAVGTAMWGMSFWEVQGITGNISSDVLHESLASKNGSGSYTTLTSENLTTQTATRMLLTAFFGQAATDGWTWTGPSGWTSGAAFVGNATDPANSLYDWSGAAYDTVSGNTTYAPVAILGNATTYWGNSFFELAGGSSTETGTVSMALGGVGFAAAENDTHAGTSLALHGIALSAGGGREESGVATVALSKASFSARSGREETGTGTLALQGVAITVSAVDINALNPVRQFSTFG